MERRFLKARRRQDCGGNTNTNQFQQPKNSGRDLVSNTGLPNTFQGARGAPKNLAKARMKRLRESLAKDLNESNESTNSIGRPPAKRFAPAIQEHCSKTIPPENVVITLNAINHKSAAKEDILVSKESAQKRCICPSMSSPKPTVNKRLREAVTSTPLKVVHSAHFISPEGQVGNFSFSQFASTSDIAPMNDADANIVDCDVSNTCNSNLFSTSASNVSLICHANDSVRDEDMDWTPSEADLISNIREARQSFQELHAQNFHQSMALNKVGPSEQKNPKENIYVIVDTNIFIHRLQTIINIMHIAYTDKSQPVIYVPWMVLQELDYFKDGYSLSKQHPISQVIQKSSRKAVKFINECLIAGKSNFKGQPVQRAAENRLKGNTADDSILGCCMQLFSEGYEVMLLSSDINLRNKAMISNITAFAPTEIVNELKKKPLMKNVNFVDEISKKLQLICSFILHFEIKTYYGEHEYKKKGFNKLPWHFRDCIKYLSDHYEPVFHLHVPKQCRKVVDDLKELLFVNEEIVNEVKFMELCLSLLIYFQTGLPKYEVNIHHTIEEIKQLERDFLH